MSFASPKFVATVVSRWLAAVVYVPWPAKDATSVMNAFEELFLLGITKVTLVYDRKSKQGKRITEAVVNAFGDKFVGAGGLITPLEVDINDTGFAWHLGILNAFETNPEVKAVFLFPGDFDREKCDIEDLRDKLREMCAAAGENTLIVGDYVCKPGESGKPERFKSHFDFMMSLPAVESLFGELLAKVKDLGISKLRSEYFVVGSKVIELFEEHYRFQMGSDPTLPLILFVLESDELTVSKVELGELIDDPSGRSSPIRHAQQILRFAFELGLDRVLHDAAAVRFSKEDAFAEMRRYNELCQSMETLFAVILMALRDNAQALDSELLAQSMADQDKLVSATPADVTGGRK